MLLAQSRMNHFVTAENRPQSTLLPASLDHDLTESNPVCVVDVFVDNRDLSDLGFQGLLKTSNKSAR
ncbi:transposase IS4 family protein [Salinisphaera shabanensis E1L3A]|jgi:hypothetical protein|uniref:Transposase IS4 family protein n=1 Tax=Salinisphaera shabanensis E1L3A TaxID=1033802 RepID=U2EQB4_9GAMM|nr:transposase IS4 family protein [Salinisphaera shabanensis E1L3A]